MASLTAQSQSQQGSGMFNLVKLMMKSGTFKFAFARSFGGTYNTNSTNYFNNPTLTSGQIAVYFVTLYTSYCTINTNADFRPEGIFQMSGADVVFNLNSSVRINTSSNTNQDTSLAPLVTQGICTSSSAYSGTQLTTYIYSYTNNSGVGPCLHATVSCFIYTPFT
jgi:hypothetical protein